MCSTTRALVGLGDLGLPILYDVRVSVSINREFEFVMMATRLSPHTLCCLWCEGVRKEDNHIAGEVFESLTSHSSGHSSSTHMSHCRCYTVGAQIRDLFFVHIDFTTSCLCVTPARFVFHRYVGKNIGQQSNHNPLTTIALCNSIVLQSQAHR